MDFALVLFIALLVTGFFSAWDRFVRRPRLAREGRTESKDPILIEYSKAFFPVILIVFVLRSFVAEPFRIPSGSMLPSLHIGDFILVNKFIYGVRLPIIDEKVIDISEPGRGEVMVFRFPHDESINYIKRVVGLPGDQVEYRDKQLIINGEPIPRTAAGEEALEEIGNTRATMSHFTEVLDGVNHSIFTDSSKPGTNMSFSVPEGHYFVMGDNRDYSNDSRYWGFVPEENIIGKAFFIWFSWESRDGGSVNWSRIGNSID
jgi:signal peptidase I